MTTPRKLPKHGTVPRYRIELKQGTPCDKCRAANSLARRQYRAAAKKRSGPRILTLVPDTHPEHTNEVTAPTSDQSSKNDDTDPALGDMETAVKADLAEKSSTVAFHRSLEAMALTLAREVDSAESKASKASSIKQMYEVLKALRGEEGNGEQGTDALLELFNQPLPGMSTTDRD